jgi:hypothetical protein
VGAVIDQVNPALWNKSSEITDPEKDEVITLYNRLEQSNVQMQNGSHQLI